jgi:hypothetical protein
MATYMAFCRSNYFQVKDSQKFLDWCEDLGLTTLPAADPSTFAIFPDEAWPSQNVKDEEIDFEQELSSYLVDDSIAILMEVGYEGSRFIRYVAGFAIAINSNNEQVVVNLDDIVELAAKTFGETATITHSFY